MASVKLKLKTTQTLINGEHPVIIQILKEKKKAIVSLGIRCSAQEWSSKLNLPKNRRD